MNLPQPRHTLALLFLAAGWVFADEPEMVIYREVPSHNAFRNAAKAPPVGVSPGAIVSQQVTQATGALDDSVLAGVGASDSGRTLGRNMDSGRPDPLSPRMQGGSVQTIAPALGAVSSARQGGFSGIGAATSRIAPAISQALGGLTGGLK